MTPFTENNSFDAQVESYDTTDPVQGGSGGVANTPLQSLVNRTRYLFNQVALVILDLATLAPINSPNLTGTPTGPTPPSGDNSTKLATTAFAQALSGFHGAQTLTGANTYTVAANVYAIHVERWGGGGGGGGAIPGGPGTGGGGGAYAADWLTVTPGQQIGYSAGAPGAAAAPGGQTTFGTLAPVPGGSAGGSNGVAGGDGGGVPQGAQVAIAGGDAQGGFLVPLASGNGVSGVGGAGGASPRGGAGGGIANGNPGNPGSGFGAGGGGAGCTASTGYAGSPGCAGAIVVRY